MYPIYTPPVRPLKVDAGVSLDADMFGQLADALNGLGPQIQNVTNQWANLQAQNEDIAGGRWTVNNLVYQWGQLDGLGKLAIIGLGWLILRNLTK